MHLLPLLLYAAAAAAYAVHFAWRDERVGRLATGLLGGGVLAHTFVIGMQTVHAGHAPLVGTTAAVSAFVWLLGLSYLWSYTDGIKVVLDLQPRQEVKIELEPGLYVFYISAGWDVKGEVMYGFLVEVK